MWSCGVFNYKNYSAAQYYETTANIDCSLKRAKTHNNLKLEIILIMLAKLTFQRIL